MRLLFIIAGSKYKGGTEILTANLFAKLNECGFECFLFSNNSYITTEEHIIPFPEKDFEQWINSKGNILNKLSGNYFSDTIFRKMLLEVICNYGIDWVICHSLDMVSSLPIVGTCKTAQIYHWSIDGFEQTILSDIKNKTNLFSKYISLCAFYMRKWRWHRQYAMLNQNIVLTNSAKSEIFRHNKSVKSSQITSIPDPLLTTTDCKVISSLNNKKLIFVGRFSPEKGVMRLLRIWEMLENKLADYTLELFGEGQLEEEMRFFIKEHGLERVKFMGFTTNIESIYSNADLCLMTSETEGFGMVLIESMYYGVPCISFDCPISPKEIIADAGITIPCFDEERYASSVEALLNDKKSMKRLQFNAINRAKDFYIDKVIQKWIELLNPKNI